MLVMVMISEPVDHPLTTPEQELERGEQICDRVRSQAGAGVTHLTQPLGDIIETINSTASPASYRGG